MYRDIPNDMKDLIEPVVADHGFELMNVETVQASGPTLLRITIDTRTGDGRVPLDSLASVSREVGSQLDAADSIPGAYRLEVSSPGLDRMLAREKDFVAACGSEIKLKTRRPLDGRRRFRGVLEGFADGVASIVVEGQRREIPFEDVEKANSVYTFSSADFNVASTAAPSIED